jgi:sRNA-binding protein
MPTPQDAADRNQGFRESREKIPLLRAKWPLAFPVKNHEVRPLAIGVAKEVAAAMDWPLWYAIGVLQSWKARKAYCRAVLWHDRRISLDGMPKDELVDDDARRMAKTRLDNYAAKAAPAEQPAPPEQLAPAAAAPIAAKAPALVGESKPAPLADSSGRLSLAGLKAAYRQRQQAGAA